MRWGCCWGIALVAFIFASALPAHGDGLPKFVDNQKPLQSAPADAVSVQGRNASTVISGAMLRSSAKAALQEHRASGEMPAQLVNTLLRAFDLLDLIERTAAYAGSHELKNGIGVTAFGVSVSLAAINQIHTGARNILGSPPQQLGSGRALSSNVEELLAQAKQNEVATLRGGDLRYDMEDVLRRASRDPDLLIALQDSTALAQDIIAGRGAASHAASKDAEARKEAADTKPAAKELKPSKVAAGKPPPARERRKPVRIARAAEQPGKPPLPQRCRQLMADIAKFEALRKTYRAQGFGSLVEWGIRVKKAAYGKGC